MTEESHSLIGSGGDWAVLHVRPRCEKKTGDYCEHYNVLHYLPLREETKIYQRRKVTVFKPLFPGYVFANVPREDRETVLRSNNVVRIIEVDNQEFFLWELEQIRRALDVDSTLGATTAFTKGKLVRVLGGPFRGLEGVIQSVTGSTRVVLNVDMIGQGVAVSAEMEMLEPID